jgi:hypothetical protein
MEFKVETNDPKIIALVKRINIFDEKIDQLEVTIDRMEANKQDGLFR